MSFLRALALFPVRPGVASQALAGSRAAWAAPLVPAALLACFLIARGCALRDALAAGAGLGLLVLGLGVGGTCAGYPAGLVLGRGRPVGAHLGPCLVFAAWSAVLFPVLLGLATLAGAGAAAALAGSLTLLVWGVAAGMGLLSWGAAAESGRALVASCTGLSGALLGLVAALLVSTQLVSLRRMPAATPQARAGALVLVVHDTRPAPGALVFLRASDAPEALLARVTGEGVYLPLGVDAAAWRPEEWAPRSRIFFRLGGPGGGSAIGGP
ncbi:MAG: hypothetical protein ACYTEZ_16445 [Planctomycetota bacterium]